MLLFAHSDAVTFEARDSLEWAGIFSSIRAAKGGEVLSFTDSNGRLVMFSTDELMLLAAPTVFVEEGYKQIYFREREPFLRVNLHLDLSIFIWRKGKSPDKSRSCKENNEFMLCMITKD